MLQETILRTPPMPQNSSQRSPRVPKVLRVKYHPSSVVRDEIGWQVSKVLDPNGHQPRYAVAVHSLCEYDILLAHSMFTLTVNVA